MPKPGYDYWQITMYENQTLCQLNMNTISQTYHSSQGQSSVCYLSQNQWCLQLIFSE